MSQVAVLTGPERRRRWSQEDQSRIVTAAFAPGATVSAVARQYDVATSVIYRWRHQQRSGEPGFAKVVVTPDQAATLPSGPQMVEVEIAGKLRVRIPANTPPALAAAILKALGVS